MQEVNNEDADLNPLLNNPLGMFVLSTDQLFFTETDQTLSSGWPDRPPMYDDDGPRSDSFHNFKTKCLKGVPPALRCAVWISSIVRVSNPDRPKAESDDYGTLKMVRVLDHGWQVVLKQMFPDVSDEHEAHIPKLGLASRHIVNLMRQDHGAPIPPKGIQSLTRVLCAAQTMLNVEYCPLLPDLTAILLTVMPESYVHACIREMVNADTNAGYFVPLGKAQHYAWCKTFADLMKRMYPQTAEIMEANGSLAPNGGLDPIFRRFFCTILKREHVLRIMDIFTIEGGKVLFRIGTALLCLCKAYLKSSSVQDADSWWKGVRTFTHSSKFHFDVLIEQAYGFHGNRFRTRSSFPTRDFLMRLVKHNEQWAAESINQSNIYNNGNVFQTAEKPLGFVEGDVPMKLAKQAPDRQRLASWLPISLKSTKLDLIYSTNVHGRSVKSLYEHCAHTKHSILLLEVLKTGATIGMFATQTWHSDAHSYGDRECFLFRLNLDPVCYKWRTKGTRSFDIDDNEENDDGSSNILDDKEDPETDALIDLFMVGRNSFISMGGNKQGMSGLRLNEDLSRGSSVWVEGFQNEPLAGEDLPEFEVGLVEVYRLMREVDGKAVDGEGDPWAEFFR